MIYIKGNTFAGCESCLRIKGMKKNPNPMEDLDIVIEENTFESVKNNCLYLEHLYPGRFSVVKNTMAKCNSVAVKLFGCRAVKDDILFSDNSISNIYNVAMCIDGSVVKCNRNIISACQGGLTLQLYVMTNSSVREEAFNSHKDVILRDTVKDIKDSYLGGNGSGHSQGIGSMSLLGIGGNGGSPSNTGTDCNAMVGCSRVILKDNIFKEIAHYGILVNCNDSCSIKVENCKFRNIKEPVIINEKDIGMSRNNTRNFIQPDSSDLLAPTYCATPRQILQHPGKGTIIVKNNLFEGAESCIIRKHVCSYLYDINNVRQSKKHILF